MKISFLISRQNLYPTINDQWVKKVFEAFKVIKNYEVTIFTSVFIPTWELQIYLCKKEYIKQIIVVPAKSNNEFFDLCTFYKDQFLLDERISTFYHLNIDSVSDKEISHFRDSYIINHSDVLYPISIREKGFFSKLLSANTTKSDTIFKIPYFYNHIKKSYKINIANCKGIPESIEDKYLFHWTRKTKSKWPDENYFDYYNSIINSSKYTRDAFSTLNHILDKMCICSSDRHLSKNCKSVSFSGLNPKRFIDNFRWRKRYTEMSFEPYGIGIDKKYALNNGFVKVEYVEPINIKNVDIDKKWMVHSKGISNNWSNEEEYRFSGDVDLSLIPKDKLLCICLHKNEAQEIQKKFHITSYSYYYE